MSPGPKERTRLAARVGRKPRRALALRWGGRWLKGQMPQTVWLRLLVETARSPKVEVTGLVQTIRRWRSLADTERWMGGNVFGNERKPLSLEL